MNPQQKKALPLYISLALIVLATALLVSFYGSEALSVRHSFAPSQEMIDHVIKEAENSIRQGRYHNAAGVLRRLLADVPHNTQALLMMSVSCYCLDQLDQAERICRKLLKIYPANARLYNNLGEILIRKGELQKGIGFLKQALELAPDMPLIHSNLSLAFSAAGNFELAQKYRYSSNFLIQCGAVNSMPYMLSNAQPRPVSGGAK
ncbi:MAG: tetratricopeptide repeat protein [Lentisphaeria bacterium]|nr:tetratricopeptide repeat protein [Lentisphaeria bacterium]